MQQKRYKIGLSVSALFVGVLEYGKGKVVPVL
jgi:hypothetical protein